MKIALWSLFLILTLMWTGATVLVAEAIEWVSERLVLGSPQDLEMLTNNIVIPAWLNPWLSPSTWATILQTVQSVTVSVASGIPILGNMIGWIPTLIWLTWGLGMITLLALTIAAAVFLTRVKRS